MKKLKKMTFANIDKMLEANQIQALPELQSIVGGGSGTSSDPFSWNEFMEMSFAGNWAGGYVDGMGYIAYDLFSFGNQAYPGQVSQTTYTLTEYAKQLEGNSLEYLIRNGAAFSPDSAGKILSIVNFVQGFYELQDKNMAAKFLQDLIARGYSGDQLFYMVRTTTGIFEEKYTVYDGISGDSICSHSQYMGVNTK